MRDNIIKPILWAILFFAPGAFVFGVTNKNNSEEAASNETGERLLRYAEEGDLEAIKRLVDESEDVDLDYQDYYGYTALITACLYGHEDLVRFLLEEGANPNIADEWSNTPLMLACSKGHDSIAKTLILSGKVDLSESEVEQKVVATYACTLELNELAQLVFLRFASMGNLELMQYIFEYQREALDLHARTPQGETAHALALSEGHEDIVAWLNSEEVVQYFESRASVNESDVDDDSSFFWPFDSYPEIRGALFI